MSEQQEKKAIQIARENKYKVMKVPIGSHYYFILAADPIPFDRVSENSSSGGKDIIAIQIGWNPSGKEEDKIAMRKSRMKDMQEDCAKFYGKNSETYKKIIWSTIY